MSSSRTDSGVGDGADTCVTDRSPLVPPSSSDAAADATSDTVVMGGGSSSSDEDTAPVPGDDPGGAQRIDGDDAVREEGGAATPTRAVTSGDDTTTEFSSPGVDKSTPGMPPPQSTLRTLESSSAFSGFEYTNSSILLQNNSALMPPPAASSVFETADTSESATPQPGTTAVPSRARSPSTRLQFDDRPTPGRGDDPTYEGQSVQLRDLATIHLTKDQPYVCLPPPPTLSHGGCVVYTLMTVGFMHPTVVTIPASARVKTSERGSERRAPVCDYSYLVKLDGSPYATYRIAVCMTHLQLNVLHPVLDACIYRADMRQHGLLQPEGSGRPRDAERVARPFSNTGALTPSSITREEAQRFVNGPSPDTIVEEWKTVLFGDAGVTASLINVETFERGVCPCHLLDAYPAKPSTHGLGTLRQEPFRSYFFKGAQLPPLD